MELINNLQHEPRQYQHSYFRSTVVLLLVLVVVRAGVTAGRPASGTRAFLLRSRSRGDEPSMSSFLLWTNAESLDEQFRWRHPPREPLIPDPRALAAAEATARALVKGAGLAGLLVLRDGAHVPLAQASPPRSSHRPSPPAQIAVLIGITHALVIYRVVAVALFTQSSWELLREQANTAAVVTGAVLHYVTIVIMTKVRRGTRGGRRVSSSLRHHPPALVPVSCRSTGVWLCISATWVRGAGRCAEGQGGSRRAGTPFRPEKSCWGGAAGAGHGATTWVSLPSPEKPRTFSQRENNFTVKIFTFQFFTNFSSLIYIAFFLGR